MQARLSAANAVAPDLIATASLTIETQGEGFCEITADVARFLTDVEARDGALFLYVRHTSASLVIQENADPDVRTDLTTALRRLAPANAGWVHDTEGPDDMPAHVKHAHGRVAARAGDRRQARTWNLAGALFGRAPDAAAPPRGDPAVHWQPSAALTSAQDRMARANQNNVTAKTIIAACIGM
jgi:secondary thiamine-phosphate synthase enzyme